MLILLIVGKKITLIVDFIDFIILSNFKIMFTLP